MQVKTDSSAALGSATLCLACELIRRPSVTPEDGGCQEYIADRLSKHGFNVESMHFGEVSNLWLRRGANAPLFVFLGHTDVVPSGQPEQWRSPPFEPTIDNGVLRGRGAADMKSSIAAFVTACERFLDRYPSPRGSIAMLLTSDEEGPATDGVRRVMETLLARGETIDWCLVGEPTSVDCLGDTVKPGRRGSLSGALTVHGKQGHVAYPRLAINAVHQALPALVELSDRRWDEGTDVFPPTTFQIANIHAGIGVTNVIPGSIEIQFNFRFSPANTRDTLVAAVEAILQRHKLNYDIDWTLSALPFVTAPGVLIDTVLAAVQEVVNITPILATTGGTSDARFIAPTGAEVIELGPINRTIHCIDEEIALPDLEQLSAIYECILRRLLVGHIEKPQRDGDLGEGT